MSAIAGRFPAEAVRRRFGVVNGLLLVLLAGAGVGAYLVVSANGSSSSTGTVRTAAVQQGVVMSTVSATGALQSAQQLDVGFHSKGRAAAAAAAAVAQPLEAIREFFLAGRRFIGGKQPSIADIRLAATLEFLRAIDYEFPAWTEDYLAAVESALGDAYSEPAADVRGYIESVRAAPVGT